MHDKPKEKVYAERFDASKKEREQLSKEAIKQHENEKPQQKKHKNLSLQKKKIYCNTNFIFFTKNICTINYFFQYY
ncbi:MAG: hypothetical protein IC227_04085 [Enterococcus lacertideformus]|uniref:Uncharacterized protein n=1 Tax=Enterococcus lacertideformus TaxID=2771493 RepID=A0A931ATR4_9ENTE|nr:hypothetical protein [Enterococcus lacertideformus]